MKLTLIAFGVLTVVPIAAALTWKDAPKPVDRPEWGRKAASSEVGGIQAPSPELVPSGEEHRPDYFTRRVRAMDQFGGIKQNN